LENHTPTPGNPKVAVVTGGSRGIGRGIVRALAQDGWSVAVNYRSDAAAASEACHEAQAAGAPEAHAFRADVSDLAAGAALVQSVLDRFQRIDLWVNNAGVAPDVRRDLLETTPESWDRVLDTNVRGPFFLTQHVARALIHLRDRGVVAHPQIVFITSVSANTASVGRGEYCASKAALAMVAQLYALRLADHGIPVFEVRPGIIATDMTASVHAAYDARIADGLAPLRRWGTPDDVGRTVAAIANGAYPYSTGQIIYVDGGLHLRRL
jgi:NAD(P)-dependent dehydrogenase (short-subunit alcohol dehydrogenase family)